MAEMLASRNGHVANLSLQQLPSPHREAIIQNEKDQNGIHPSKQTTAPFAHPHGKVNWAALYGYYGENAVASSHLRPDDASMRLWQDILLNRRSSATSGMNFSYSFHPRNLYLQQRCRNSLQALYFQQQQQQHQRSLQQRKIVNSAALLHQLWANETNNVNGSRFSSSVYSKTSSDPLRMSQGFHERQIGPGSEKKESSLQGKQGM